MWGNKKLQYKKWWECYQNKTYMLVSDNTKPQYPKHKHPPHANPHPHTHTHQATSALQTLCTKDQVINMINRIRNKTKWKTFWVNVTFSQGNNNKILSQKRKLWSKCQSKNQVQIYKVTATFSKMRNWWHLIGSTHWEI